MVDFKKLHTIFVEEATERLGELENGLLRLEEAPGDKELLNTIFRAAHTIKGSSGTVGLTDIARFTHALEEALDLMRRDALVADKEVISLFLEATDQIKGMVECVASETAFDGAQCAGLTARLEALTRRETAADGERSLLIKFRPGADLFRRGIDPALLIDELKTLGEVVTIKAHTDTVPSLSAFNPEDLYLRWDIHLKTERPEEDLRKVFEFVEDGSDLSIAPLSVQEGDLPFIGQMLVSEGAVKPADVEEALKSQKRLGEILVEQGKISPQDLARVVEKQNTKKIETLRNAISATIRVDLNKLEHLINTVGEMVIIHSMLQQTLYGIAAEGAVPDDGAGGLDPDARAAVLRPLGDLFCRLHGVVSEIQESAMSLRMLPVGEVFHRFARVVRELSVSNGKQIELSISGEETELDKGVLEKITDPLVHLIRNAVDHGIETPDERTAAGKPPKGSLCLSAFQRGDAVFIEIGDDGKGLNKEKILGKAQALGLLPDPAGAGQELTDEQIYALIFHPGLSTAERVSDVSGRGVGMDVVKKNIEALNGQIYIRTQAGAGTIITIKLPLTLAIIDGLIVQVGGEPFVIPLSLVTESLRPRQEEIKTLNERGEVIKVRGDYIPLIRLGTLLGTPAAREHPWEAIVIITAYEGKRYGLMADELAGRQQIVLKTLGAATPKVKDIAGGAILGNGKVALVLDVPGIVELGTHCAASGCV